MSDTIIEAELDCSNRGILDGRILLSELQSMLGRHHRARSGKQVRPEILPDKESFKNIIPMVLVVICE